MAVNERILAEKESTRDGVRRKAGTVSTREFSYPCLYLTLGKMPKILPDTNYVATVILQHIYSRWNTEEGKTVSYVLIASIFSIPYSIYVKITSKIIDHKVS